VSVSRLKEQHLEFGLTNLNSKEIFPITRVLKDPRQLDAAGWEYEQVVKTAILRWEAFVREIMA
jgi:hypothetical protein